MTAAGSVAEDVRQEVEQAPASGRGSLEGRVRSGALWGALNTLGIRIANIAVMAVVVRLVTPEEFGVFAAALTVAVVVSGFADWGVSAFLMRADFDLDAVAPTVTTIAVASGGLLGLGVALAAPDLASLFGAPAATDPIRVMSLCLVFGGPAAVPTALLGREFRQDRILLSNVAGFVPANAVLLVLAFEGAGAMAFAWSRVIMVVCQGMGAAWLSGRLYLPGFARRHVRTILRFGVPLAGANLVNYALVNADYALIGHQLGAARLGVYMLAFNVASWSMAVLSSAINGVAMPAFSRVGTEHGDLLAALRRSARAVGLVALPIAALTLALADPLVHTLYGGQWGDSVPVLEVLAVYGLVFVLISLLSNILVGRGRTARALVIQLVWITALIPAMMVGARLDGLEGVAWAHVLVVVVVVLPLYLRAVSRLVVSGVVRAVAHAMLPPLAASAVAAAAAMAVAAITGPDPLRLLLSGAAGAVCYLVLCASMLADLLGDGRRSRIGSRLRRVGLTTRRMGRLVLRAPLKEQR